MKRTIELVLLLAVCVVALIVGRNKLAVVLYNQGNGHFERERYAQARDSFLASISVDPSLPQSQYSLGLAYQHLGDIRSAVSRFRKAIQQDPRFIPSYRALASLYAESQDYEQALSVLASAETAAGQNPDIETQRQTIIIQYLAFELNAATDAFLAHDRDQAYAGVRKAIAIKPDYPFAHYTLGYFLYADKKYPDAHRSLEQAILLDPGMWLAHRILGDIAFDRAEFEEAVRRYRSAISVWNKSAQLYCNLGLSYMNLERYDEAIEPLRTAVSLEPGNISMRYSLASVYRDSGRYEDALREYAQVVQARPEFPNVHNDIGAIYEYQGRVDAARDAYALEIGNDVARLRVAGEDPVTLTSLAYAYCGTGAFDKAEEAVGKALRLAPAYREAYLARARIYQKTSRPQDALAALEKARTFAAHSDFIAAQIASAKQDIAGARGDAGGWRPTQRVVLKNGGQFSGVVIEELPDKILLETLVGSTRGIVTLYRGAVERIVAAE